jgi:phytoene dehydrogenase-like protein
MQVSTRLSPGSKRIWASCAWRWSLDQMFSMRPLAGWARYRTPVRGLYLCGSGAHPGGGVMGAPGYNAAREILAGKEIRGRT